MDAKPISNRAKAPEEVKVSQTQQTQESHAKPSAVEVDVRYLPAAHPFHQTYPPETTLETVRTEAMNYFGVQDRTERDTYRYYLGFEGQRVTDTSQTLAGLIGQHREGVHFELIEEITPGRAW